MVPVIPSGSSCVHAPHAGRNEKGKLSPLKYPITYRSPRGFLVFPYHYSQDPAKGRAWAVEERKKYDKQADWDKEQEIDFTSLAGVPAFPGYSATIHDREDLCFYNSHLPLCLAVDFNVAPMIWEIGQIRRNYIYWIDEIYMTPASVPAMTREFRNKYPAHQNDVWIYGDSTGLGRDPQTAQSDYELILLEMKGYPVPVEMKVPVSNPKPKDRNNAVNRKMKGADGQIGMYLHPTKCPNLKKDLTECVLNANQSDVHQVRKLTDPYHERSHASSCVGYLIQREWPVIDEEMEEILRKKRRRPQRRVYRSVLGSV